MGTPARPRVANLRGQAAPKRLERLAQRVSELEARLAALESGTGSA
jgi:BMFP domain-containing protein YqiC